MAEFSPFSLSSLDHALLAVYIPQNLCFRTSDHEQCLSRLRAGIDLLLARLPFLAGEVVPRTDDGAKPGELRVQPGNTFDAIPMLTIKHFPDVILPPLLVDASKSPNPDRAVAKMDGEFFSLPFILPPSEPRPIMRLQANVVADGVILSMAFSHSVLDGTGTGIIHEMLAECCRAATTNSTPSFPTDGDEEAALRNRLTTAGEGEHPEIDHSGEIGQSYAYEGKDEDEASKEEDEASKPKSRQLLETDLMTRAFIFSPEKLARLQKACTGFLPLLTRLYSQKADGAKKWPTFLSSNDVLNGLVGVCIEKARGENGVDVSSPSRHLTFAVNYRKRLTVIPDHYLGNTVFPSRVYFKLPVDEYPDFNLAEKSVDLHGLEESGVDAKRLFEIANQAFQSRAGILSYDDEFLRSWMAYVTGQPDYEAMNLRFGDLIGSSWRDLKINSLDFGPGLGQVDNFEINIGVADGACTVLPETRRDPSASASKAPWDVRISLKTQTMSSFERDLLIDWLADRVV